jgi:hypothetical protein
MAMRVVFPPAMEADDGGAASGLVDDDMGDDEREETNNPLYATMLRAIAEKRK